MHQRSALAISGGVLIAILTCVPTSPAQDKPVTANSTPVGPATAKQTNQISGRALGAEQPVLHHRNPRYQLCASDALVLTFPLTPEFDQTVNVQPDGFVSLAGAGDVHLEGLTTREAVAAVQAAYTQILHEPLITIELKDFNKPYFTVGGEVAKPGKFDLRGYTTATEAVAMAGGFNDSSKHSQVLLFRRRDDNWTEVTTLDLKHVLKGLDINEDPEIRPGDMLYVPQNFLSKIKKWIPNSSFGGYYTY